MSAKSAIAAKPEVVHLKSFHDAEAAGYTKVSRAATLEPHGRWQIRYQDTSGPDASGLSYDLIAEFLPKKTKQDEIPKPLSTIVHGSTVTVYIGEYVYAMLPPNVNRDSLVAFLDKAEAA